MSTDIATGCNVGTAMDHPFSVAKRVIAALRATPDRVVRRKIRGVIVIAEGEIWWGDNGPRGFGTAAALQLMVKDVHDWVRQVRGGFLSGAFAIERNLSAAIIHYFLGQRVAVEDVQEAFDVGILQALTFDRRISVAKLIADRCMTREASKAIYDGLNMVKSVRNVMAHQPFALLPQFNDDGSIYCLTPIMKQGKGNLILTTDFVSNQNDLVKRMIESSQNLLQSVLANREVARADTKRADDIVHDDPAIGA